MWYCGCIPAGPDAVTAASLGEPLVTRLKATKANAPMNRLFSTTHYRRASKGVDKYGGTQKRHTEGQKVATAKEKVEIQVDAMWRGPPLLRF